MGILAPARWPAFSGTFWPLLLMAACWHLSAPAADELRYVVQGTVQHEQLGPSPRREGYRFSARCDGCAWSVSSEAEPRQPGGQVLAVGNEEGVFVTRELSGALLANPPPNAIPNTSQALVLPNTVPNSMLAPQLGVIWLTYLSHCYLKTADPRSFPPPVPFNIAGGAAAVTVQSKFTLKCSWQTDPKTGLPTELIGVDDGLKRAIYDGELVVLRRYDGVFGEGFTNLVFRVNETTTFSNAQFPRRATLEVFWVRESKLEPIHRYTIETERIVAPPATPLPMPSLRGIATVADLRLSSTNRTVIVPYIGTNRFLKPSELTNLSGFREAVQRSLSAQPPTLPALARGRSARFVVLGLLLASTIGFVFLVIRKRLLSR